LETRDEQREIESLAKAIHREISDNFYHGIDNQAGWEGVMEWGASAREYWLERLGRPVELVKFIDIAPLLRSMLEEWDVSVYWSNKLTGGALWSGFVKAIFLGISDGLLREIAEVLRDDGGDRKSRRQAVNRAKDIADSVLRGKQDSLVHELQHAWDDWRSKGKIAQGGVYGVDEFDKYLASPHEVNARYSAAVAKLRWAKRADQPMEWVNKVMSMIDGFTQLPSEVQKRLKVRATAEYYDREA